MLTAELLKKAAGQLAARDADHASVENAVGFNQSDTWYGHSIAVLPAEDWTPDITAHAWHVLRKYAGQLAAYGVDFAAIPVPDVEWTDAVKQNARTGVWEKMGSRARPRTAEEAEGKVEVSDRLIVLRFTYDAEVVAAVKDIPGRSWDGDAKVWRIEKPTVRARAMVEALAQQQGWTIEGDLKVSEEQREDEEARRRRNVDAPRRLELIEHDPSRIRVVFPYDPAVKDDLKRTCPTARFDKDTKSWIVSVSDAAPLREYARRHQFRAPLAVHQALGSAEEVRRDRRAGSAALDAQVDLVGFGVEPHPFQRAGIAYALQMRRTFVADEMGLGKTIQALGTIHQAGAFPAFVVCPNNVVKKWARETLRALPGRRVSFLNGTDTRPIPVRLYDGSYELIPVNDYSADVLIVNYDKLPRWIAPRLDEAGQPVKKHKRAVYDPTPASPLAVMLERGIRAIVLDESHYVKSRDAKRTAALQLLADRAQPEIRLALSGTPILNRPNELVEQLRVLDRLDDLGGSGYFLRRYCAGHQGSFGYDTSGAPNLPELHDRLREVGYVRRLKRDVLTELPAKQRDSIELPITNRDEYAEAQAEIIRWLREQAFKKAILADMDADEAEAVAADKAARAAMAEVLVRMNALRKLAAEGVVEAAVEWAREFLDSTGEKLVLWAFHRDVQAALYAALADYSPARVEAGGDKDAEVRKFQTDPDCRVIVCSISAGREGIELTAASNAAFVELEWRPGVHDQAEDRCYGRLDDPHGMNAYYLLAERTIYADMAELIDAKRVIVDAATDGKVGTTGRSILGSLVAKMIGEEE